MARPHSALLHIIALICLAAVAIALVSQYAYDMRPCAWCVLQRLVYLLIAVSCWMAVLVRRYTWALRAFTALAALLAFGGAMAAWYQYSVASVLFSCDQTFADRFISHSGLDAQLPWLFGIFATCMDARVQLLGVEYALWSLGLFVLILLGSGLAFFAKPVYRDH